MMSPLLSIMWLQSLIPMIMSLPTQKSAANEVDNQEIIPNYHSIDTPYLFQWQILHWCPPSSMQYIHLLHHQGFLFFLSGSSQRKTERNVEITHNNIQLPNNIMYNHVYNAYSGSELNLLVSITDDKLLTPDDPLSHVQFFALSMNGVIVAMHVWKNFMTKVPSKIISLLIKMKKFFLWCHWFVKTL